MAPAHELAQGTLTVGRNYAILNLDLIAVLIDAVRDTPEGQKFILSVSRWNDAVHEKDPRPLTIFTSLFFKPEEPALPKGSPFGRLVEGFGSFATGSPRVQIAPEFIVDEKDVFLQKTRWYAGTGNSLEQILQSRNIDTVIMSLPSWNVTVISDNVLELPPAQNPEYAKLMLGSLLPKMNLKVVTLDEALKKLDII